MHRIRPKRTAAVLATATILSLAACGGHANNPSAENAAGSTVTPAATNAPPAPATGTAAAVNPADTSTATHHSKLGGAVLGAAAGHVVGGTKGAIAGAVIGAEIQHHRNKAYERAHP